MMKKYITALLTLIICSTAIVCAQNNLSDKFIGSWQGKGTLMGSEATFKMNWEKELGGQFLKLTFQNKRTPKGKDPIIFNAMAMYRPLDKTWTGTWFDVRGVSFALKGTIDGNTLIVEWGSPDIEQGRTVYALQSNGSMKVSDFIKQNGGYSSFGEAVYTKTVHE